MSKSNTKLLKALYWSLNERQRPEDIAQLILELRTDLTEGEKKALEKAAKKSLKSVISHWFTSMPTDFKQPHGLYKQLAKAEQLFRRTFSSDKADYFDTEKVETFLSELSSLIGKTMSKSDFKKDRVNAEARKKAGLDISKRQYNKRFRHLARLENKLRTLMREQQKLRFTTISKSSLASEITWEDFNKDIASACFVAYYTARANRRSVFTAYGQEKAFDEIADALYQQTINRQDVNWWIIAHVYPKQEVVNNLTDEQRGVLLGKWTSILEDISKLLEEIWNKSNINRETMIVRRGNDSSTWNQAAGAWNKARDSWISLIYSLGMEAILHTVCFGKVMRLMAADVAAWHRAEGGDIDADTKVWNELPLPWEIFNRKAECSIDEVQKVCEKYGVDAEESGWITPRPRTHIEKYNPTPELVHGVIVDSPFLAKILRDAGYFSGKENKVKDLGDEIAAIGLHDEVLEQHHQSLNLDKD